MKKLACLISMLFIFQFSYAGIQESIEKAFNEGNVNEISTYFGKSVDFTLLGKENIYSKVQTVQILKQFFAKHPPKAFHLMHKGTSKKGTCYSIGDYISTNGKFRIYLIYSSANDHFKIQELSIEEDSKK